MATSALSPTGPTQPCRSPRAPARTQQATLDFDFHPGPAQSVSVSEHRVEPAVAHEHSLDGLADMLLGQIRRTPSHVTDLPRLEERHEIEPAVPTLAPNEDVPEKAALLLTLNSRALKAFETILAQARELAKSET